MRMFHRNQALRDTAKAACFHPQVQIERAFEVPVIAQQAERLGFVDAMLNRKQQVYGLVSSTMMPRFVEVFRFLMLPGYRTVAVSRLRPPSPASEW